MMFVVVVQSKKTGYIICVDGTFDNSADAQDYADKTNADFERRQQEYKATVQVVTRP